MSIVIVDDDVDRDELIDRAAAVDELRRRGYQRNPFQLIRDGILKIKTKAGTYESFLPNPIQSKLLDQIEADYGSGRPIRYRILKARQEGVSTVVEAVLFVLAAFRSDQNALILADDLKGANYLFDMSKLYHQSVKEYAPSFIPDLKQSNEKGLKFEANRSQIIIETGDNREAGRKYTFRIVHVSEAAFIPAMGEIMTGLLQSVPDTKGTVVILETTANGVGGYFYDAWSQPESEYSVWRNIFYAWFDNPEYSMRVEDEQRLLTTLGNDPRYNEFEGEEIELKNKYKCTNDQINWRRFAITNKCDGNLDKFHQEYPAYPEQAFLVSGRPVFNIKMLSKMRMVAHEPEIIGYLRLEDENKPKDAKITIEKNDRGYLKIYQSPIAGRNYVIGGDSMKGRISNESKRETDKASMQVMDVRTLEQVAVWEGKIDADLFGVEAVKLARHYNNAFIGIELNDGIATVARIKQIGYWNIYCRTSIDKLMDTATNQLGWWTDAKSKLLMIGELAKFIREWLGNIHDKQTISELMSYVYDDDGSMNAVDGCHDDHVVSLAIAYQMCKHYFDTPDKQIAPEDIVGSFAYWEKRIEREENELAIL